MFVFVPTWIITSVLIWLAVRDQAQKNLGLDYKPWMDYTFMVGHMLTASMAMFFTE
jgi:hypothetical protein